MLERYFVKPDTVDRIRASWLGDPIERYVTWLTEQRYSARIVFRRVPILMHFGDFAKSRNCSSWADLPPVVEPFVNQWVKDHGGNCTTDRSLASVANAARIPVEQLLGLMMPDYIGRGRPRQRTMPFSDCVPGFFQYLCEERGLRETSVGHYRFYLQLFDTYLTRIGLRQLSDISPLILSSFITESGHDRNKSAMTGICVVLRIFLRYLYREHLIPKDISPTVESPQFYRLADIPRFITWDDVQRMLDTVERRTPLGRRDYAILLLLVVYGLRAREVALLTLDDIDWKRERLRIPERKAGHSTAYPLSRIVGEAILNYLQNGRPQTTDRHVFLRVMPPFAPLGWNAISGRTSHYLHRAGIPVARPGSHTLRHTCVQMLVDAGLDLKTIGEYVGHRSASSTEIYAKVAIETLREVAMGDGEEVL
ncbi:MAG: site-specific integrase [Deltaproteobacteria bacterium]